MNTQQRPREMRRIQLSIREILLATAVVALGFAWFKSHQHATAIISNLYRRIEYEKEEQSWNRYRTEESTQLINNPTYAPIQLKRSDLRGIQLTGDTHMFSRAVFEDCNLSNAVLVGSTSAFQGSKFDNTKLRDARLTGGNSAFQFASFANADLAGAVLTGGASSFQGATFQRAQLIGSRFICSGASFQKVNLDGAQFQGADLTAIDGFALESCFFDTPPSYDATTRFPASFDPKLCGWKLMAATVK